MTSGDGMVNVAQWVTRAYARDMARQAQAAGLRVSVRVLSATSAALLVRKRDQSRFYDIRTAAWWRQHDETSAPMVEGQTA